MPRDQWAIDRRKDAGRREAQRLAVEAEYLTQAQLLPQIEPIRSFDEWAKLIEEQTTGSGVKDICVRILVANIRNEIDRFGDLVKLMQVKNKEFQTQDPPGPIRL